MPNLSLRIIKRHLPLLAVCAAVLASGCGGRRGTVSGEVRYNGKPLPSGTITFLAHSGETKVVTAEIVDGRYVAQNVGVGPAKVAVATVPPAKGGLPPRGGKPVEVTTSSAPSSPPGKYVPIPHRYANPEQSGLTLDVQPGSQTKDFELTR